MSQEQHKQAAEADSGKRTTRWLSEGFEALAEKLPRQRPETDATVDFDVIIVGTGYGGAVAAAELAKTRGGKSICVLERGSEHLAGAFPSRMADLAGHVRFGTPGSRGPRGVRDGVFDIRVGGDVCALVASGVGGGSLINAGVMAMPSRAVFKAPAWPQAVRDDADQLLALGDGLKARLGATQSVTSVNAPQPLKFQALKALKPDAAQATPVTMALTDQGVERFTTAAGITIDACVGCGDCMTGCNFNAKVSLDVTLLAEARQHGAEIFSGATVIKIEKATPKNADPFWRLRVVHTDETLRRQQGKPVELHARRVVLAAGTLGSTEILLRSHGEHLRVSSTLGHQFSSNGDMIAAAYDTKNEANCLGNEDEDPRCVKPPRRVGPTITGMLDLRQTDDMVVQDLAVPGPMCRLLEEAVTTSANFQDLAVADTTRHGSGQARDPCAVSPKAMHNTLVVAIIGHDSADGVLKLNAGEAWDDGDGAVTIQWPTLRDYPPLLQRHRRFEQLLAQSAVGGRALPNPMWRLLPEQLNYLFGGKTGPLITVHPLGGCPMGEDAASGVVDDCGRVFDAVSVDAEGVRKKHHEGLVVLDGAIVPTSLGINPALTITSLALRAISQLRQDWGYTTEPGTATDIGDRPLFKPPGSVEPPLPTKVEVLERLSGPVELGVMRAKSQNNREDPETPEDDNTSYVELTMRFDPIEVRTLGAHGGPAVLNLRPEQGRLRIFERQPLSSVEAQDKDAMLIATVEGSLTVFRPEPSTALCRRLHGWWAWLRNRGLRDTVLWGIDHLKGEAPPPTGDASIWQDALSRFKSSWDLSSRAGGVRLLEYELTIKDVTKTVAPLGDAAMFQGKPLRGTKRLTYSRRGNPWRQSMEVTLDAFPRVQGAPVLTLDTGYLARQGIPLMRIVGQQDQPTALADMGSLLLYVFRLLLQIHAWSFRLPDKPVARDIQRLPGFVPGLPQPVVHQFHVAAPRKGKPVMVRLTHYPFGAAQRQAALRRAPDAEQAIAAPVLLIHGYSASGTTFAHHAVKPNLASALWDNGKDVWIADLRTSAGMPHAKEPWTFEEVGTADIPMAIQQVLNLTGKPQVDVFAHCMGSAMLGMALLGPVDKQHEPFPGLRIGLDKKIRRLVTSQVAPAVIFTPANVFRAFTIRYLKNFFPLTGYVFRNEGTPTLGDQLLDRLLATLPYPEEEFDRENPFWPPWRRTPWVGTRHRMDALYGRDFSVNNMPQQVLDYIDDQFGPLSIETVSQAIHFARYRAITNSKGFNEYVVHKQLRENLGDLPMLHVHGKHNGLASEETPEHFQAVLRDADARFDSTEHFDFKKYPAGHQDLLIGTPAWQMFDDVITFFQKNNEPSRTNAGTTTPSRINFASQVPAYGLRAPPLPRGGTTREYSFGDNGGRGEPIVVLLVPVALSNGRYTPVVNGAPVEPSAANLPAITGWRALTKVWTSRGASEVTRQTFSLSDYTMPNGAQGVLVLAMYNASTEVGQPSPPLVSSTIDVLGTMLAKKTPTAAQFIQARTLSQPGTGDGTGSTVPIVVGPIDGLLELLRELAEKIVAGIVESILQVFESYPNVNLGLGVLKLPTPNSGAAAPTGPVSFALASCQYPAGLLDRTPPGVPAEAPAGPADDSYGRLLHRLQQTGKPLLDFLLLMGDQIYADATAGLFDPRVLDDRYRLSYEAFLGARGPRSVLSQLPTLMRLDDHEIVDNWEPDAPGANHRHGTGTAELEKEGVEAYLRNQCDQDTSPGVPRPSPWIPVVQNGLPFFLADARTQRAARTDSTVTRASILGSQQTLALDAWLASTGEPGPRFVVSASMVLPRRLRVKDADNKTALGPTTGSLHSDAWDGYPASLYHLLASVHQRGRDDVVFLSGDEHLSNVATIHISDDSGKTVIAHSVHSSALYAPYPFANSRQEDFASVDEFDFDHGGKRFHCEVSTWYPCAGDGFGVLTVTQENGLWQVAVSFDRANKKTDGTCTTEQSFTVTGA